MRRDKSQEKKIAQERIEILFSLAEKEALDGNLVRATRYVEHARTIGMRYNITPSSKHRRRYCRGCHSFLLPSVTVRVRAAGGRTVYTCLKCGRIDRYPHVRERRDRRKKESVPAKDPRKEIPQEEEV